MDLAVRIMRGGGILAAIFVFSALAPNSAARGQPAVAPPPPQFEPAPAAAPLLDPKLFNFPPAAPNHDLGKLDLGKFRNETPDLALPNRIDLGSYMLHLDTGRKGVGSVPRAGLDSGETSNLNLILPAQRQSPLMPDYFGLKLTTPTH
jgi:hypothetical protein